MSGSLGSLRIAFFGACLGHQILSGSPQKKVFTKMEVVVLDLHRQAALQARRVGAWHRGHFGWQVLGRGLVCVQGRWMATLSVVMVTTAMNREGCCGDHLSSSS